MNTQHALLRMFKGYVPPIISKVSPCGNSRTLFKKHRPLILEHLLTVNKTSKVNKNNII